MGKLVGFDKIKNYIKTDEGYILQSEWTSAETVELKSGATLQNALGSVNGIAELDSTGKVPSTQLPSYVDDVIEGYLYDGKFYKDIEHTSRINGESGKIYIDLYSEKTYRWSGSTFVVISETIALGETSSTAFRGDYGKIAYESSHTHSNKSVIDGITSALVNNWNSAKTHADSAHAPSNAEVNQNAFSNVTVGSTTIAADSKTDTLTLVAGSNVTITPDAANDRITISSTNASYTLPTATSSALGGIKTGYTASGKNYPVAVDDDGDAYVNVPWTDYSNFVKSGSGAKAGLVPAPPTTEGNTKYLREDGTWQTVLSGGNKTAYQTSEPTDQSNNDEWLAEY